MYNTCTCFLAYFGSRNMSPSPWTCEHCYICDLVFSYLTPVSDDISRSWITSPIEYKLLLYAYRALNAMYITELLQPYVAGRSLGSSDLMCVPHTRHYCGGKAFSKVAPLFRDILPLNIKSTPTLTVFKSALKTHLLKKKLFL